MKTKSIEVMIQPNGQVLMEAHGFAGADCEKATSFLEEALGWQTAQHKKPEYYRANVLKTKRRQRLGGDS